MPTRPSPCRTASARAAWTTPSARCSGSRRTRGPPRRRGAEMVQRASQTGALMQFVHRRRRGAELFLLVLALIVGVGAYACVGLGVKGKVPPDIVSYGGGVAAPIIPAPNTGRVGAPRPAPGPPPVVA